MSTSRDMKIIQDMAVQAESIEANVQGCLSDQKTGYKFIGAIGEACRFGYEKGTWQYSLFIDFFLNEVNIWTIVTNKEGFISRILKPL